MKKVLALVTSLGLVAMFVPASLTAAGYGMAGCGLGAIVIGPKPGIIQVVAATTNGTSASQTFGITTGTSECKDGAVAAEMEQRVYMTHNFDALQKDIAAGKGERINSLAYLMGCSKDSAPSLGTVAQKNYGKIFDSNEEQAPEYVLQRIKAVVKEDGALSSSCSKVWM